MGKSYFKAIGVSTFLAAIALLSFGNVESKVKAVAEQEILYGDVNGDNIVDSYDINYLKKVLFNAEKCTDNCDVNKDGMVNVFDLSDLKYCVLGENSVVLSLSEIYKNASLYISSATETVLWAPVIDKGEEGKEYIDLAIDEKYSGYSFTPIMEANCFASCDSSITTGCYEFGTIFHNFKGNDFYAGTNIIKIPSWARQITTTMNNLEEGCAGWCTYDEAFSPVRGGKSQNVLLTEDEKYIAFTTADRGDKSSFEDRKIKFLKEPTAFANSKIIIAGDSITYGANPEYSATDQYSSQRLTTPFSSTVASLLGCREMQNKGVNSGSLMDGLLGSGRPTPMALVNEYKNYDDDADVFVFMIGINDLYRGYTLGEMNDRTPDTFYGSLHVLIQGLEQKYTRNGCRVLAVMYPTYYGDNDRIRITTPLFFDAIREVCAYYSVPILELDKELGVNINSDISREFWVSRTNAHPTQKCADLIGKTIANYIDSHYSKDFFYAEY